MRRSPVVCKLCHNILYSVSTTRWMYTWEEHNHTMQVSLARKCYNHIPNSISLCTSQNIDLFSLQMCFVIILIDRLLFSNCFWQLPSWISWHVLLELASKNLGCAFRPKPKLICMLSQKSESNMTSSRELGTYCICKQWTHFASG